MKKTVLFFTVLTTLSILLSSCSSCVGGGENEDTTNSKNKDINLTVFLDLSDRLAKAKTPSQMERDIAIVENLVDWFQGSTFGPQLLETKNCMKVFFYPAPEDPEINKWASDLLVDLSKLTPGDKKKTLLGDQSGTPNMKIRFDQTLEKIYEKAIQEKKWIGCDVWDFFSSKKVDNQCIKDGFRNILVILSDGYFYHKNNLKQSGDAYSYINGNTLTNPNSSLIAERNGLENLEVLIVEVSDDDPAIRKRIEEVIGNWLTAMGVKHYDVVPTDLPINTKTAIENFLNN